MNGGLRMCDSKQQTNHLLRSSTSKKFIIFNTPPENVLGLLAHCSSFLPLHPQVPSTVPRQHRTFTANCLMSWSSTKQHFQKRFLSSCALAWVFPWLNQLPTRIHLVKNWQALNTAQSPLHPGPDIRKWLRKHSNGYQIFGNWLSFAGQAMCLGEMESLIITWPCDRPKVALSPLGKKKKKCSS